jgi:hypothetical protein
MLTLLKGVIPRHLLCQTIYLFVCFKFYYNYLDHLYFPVFMPISLLISLFE